MNRNRINFDMPLDHKIIISDHQLLCLIEEGYFHLIRRRMVPNFDIKLIEKQKPILLKIKQYLE